MNYKLSIVEPWESTSDSSTDTIILKDNGNEFLLFVENGIKFRDENAQYFICELRNINDKDFFRENIKGTYPINMVFDKKINRDNLELTPLKNYRGNFLSGEIIIL